LALSGCGAEGSAPSGGDADPASVVPANAAGYLTVTVRPTGALRTDALAAGRRVLAGADLGRSLRTLLDRAHPHGDTYEHDLAPWLGRQLAVFALLRHGRAGAGPHADYALVAAVRDRAAAQREMADERRRHNERAGGSYHGVPYDVDVHDHTWSGLVRGFVVSGNAAGFRAAVDAPPGAALGDSTRYRDAIHPLDAHRLALGYVDPQALAPLLRAITSTRAAQRATLLRRLAKAQPVTATFAADANALTLQVDGGETTKTTTDDTIGAIPLDSFPADAWLALGTPSLGPLLRTGLASAGRDAAALRRRLRELTGLDLDRDLLGWLGGVGAYVNGGLPLSVGGAVVLGSRDASASRAALTHVRAAIDRAHLAPTAPLRLAGASGFVIALRGSPQPIVVVAHDDRVVIGFGPASVVDVLKHGGHFGDAGASRAAIASLGAGYVPRFVLLPDPILTFLRLGAMGDASLRRVLPYLSAYRSFAVGSRRSGNRLSVRIVAALRDPRSAPLPPPTGGGTATDRSS
jgi:hypothetical protein